MLDDLGEALFIAVRLTNEFCKIVSSLFTATIYFLHFTLYVKCESKHK